MFFFLSQFFCFVNQCESIFLDVIGKVFCCLDYEWIYENDDYEKGCIDCKIIGYIFNYSV